jgi:hypothetical protein
MGDAAVVESALQADAMTRGMAAENNFSCERFVVIRAVAYRGGLQHFEPHG